jgi:type II secretory pathway pseudopilin PulG
MTSRRQTNVNGHREPSCRSHGVMLLALLLALALGGIAAMAAMDVWSLERQRAREQELLFVGDQYRQAVERYLFAAPQGTARTLPASLHDLLEDNRYPIPVRHLRRLYPDPITGSDDWGVVRFGDRVAGVFSQGRNVPVKQAGFAQGYEHFSGKSSYRDWVFAVSASGSPITANPASADTPASGIAPFDPPRPVRRTPTP